MAASTPELAVERASQFTICTNELSPFILKSGVRVLVNLNLYELGTCFLLQLILITRIPLPNYTKQEIKQWREARRKNYPIRVIELKVWDTRTQKQDLPDHADEVFFC
nr:nuclear fragile X mental retardation-interacting protein 1, conserved domain-containing protein [Tanacetum cinerariifolium]